MSRREMVFPTAAGAILVAFSCTLGCSQESPQTGVEPDARVQVFGVATCGKLEGVVNKNSRLNSVSELWGGADDWVKLTLEIRITEDPAAPPTSKQVEVSLKWDGKKLTLDEDCSSLEEFPAMRRLAENELVFLVPIELSDRSRTWAKCGIVHHGPGESSQSTGAQTAEEPPRAEQSAKANEPEKAQEEDNAAEPLQGESSGPPRPAAEQSPAREEQ